MPANIVVPRSKVDAAHFPVVVVTECGSPSDRERALLMEDLENLLEARGRHALVLDLTRGAQVSRDQRTYIAELFGMRAQLIAEKWAAVAVVVRSPVLHHMSVAAFWLKVLPVPSRMFPSVDAATTWVRGCLSLASTGEIPIPGALQGVRASPSERATLLVPSEPKIGRRG